MVEVKEAVRQFILAKFLPGESAANVRDETRLLSSGILDSLAALELVGFIEHEFGVELNAVERSAENLDRIADIARLVQQKRSQEGA
jgi:acyl carrier protein